MRRNPTIFAENLHAKVCVIYFFFINIIHIPEVTTTSTT